MKFIPHEYQKYAIEYIKQNPISAILLDMGLGKTVISLTVFIDILGISGKFHDDRSAASSDCVFHELIAGRHRLNDDDITHDAIITLENTYNIK